jgi:vacuolar-type H+-ATPase subunit I/STV1
LKRESHQSLSIQKEKKQRRENERCRALSSSSTIESIRENVNRDHFFLIIAYLSQRRSTQLSENKTEKSTNDINFERHFAKTHSALFELGADHKRKHEKKLSQIDLKSLRRSRRSESAAISSNLNLKKQLKLFEDDLQKAKRVI